MTNARNIDALPSSLLHNFPVPTSCYVRALPNDAFSNHVFSIRPQQMDHLGAKKAASGNRSTVYLCPEMYMMGTPGTLRSRRRKSRSHVATM